MDPIEKTAEFIGYLDLKPNWPIVISPEEQAIIKVYFYDQCYGINSSVDFSIFKENIELLELSLRSVRVRAQKDLDLELFPSIGVDKVGIFRKAIEVGLKDENYSLEAIDAEIVSVIGCSLWKKNKAFLPFIKKLLTLNATDIVKTTEPFLVST